MTDEGSNGRPNLEIEIRPLRPNDRITGLSLGDERFAPLKTFIQRHAKVFEARSLARTYAAFDMSRDGRLVAYVTLVCGEIAVSGTESVLTDDADYRYRHYPAVKIARLAVDRRLRGYAIGSRLVDLALGVATDVVAPAVGCRFVVVDAKQEATRFYERCGFTFLDTAANRERTEPVMFVDLCKAAPAAVSQG